MTTISMVATVMILSKADMAMMTSREDLETTGYTVSTAMTKSGEVTETTTSKEAH